jgi:transcriptional regulator with XRE-family HTH domain
MPPRAPRTPRYADLATYIAMTGETQASIARRVGTSQAHLSRLRHGHAVPRARLAVRLARYCRIPLDSFTRVYMAKHAQRVA